MKRELALEFARVTEAAALAAYEWVEEETRKQQIKQQLML